MVLALGLMLVVLLVFGVAADLTRLFLAKRSLQSTADAAALRAASTLDREALYRSSGVEVRVAPASARDAARAAVATRGIQVDALVRLEDRRVEVTLRSVVPTTLLGVIGIEHLPVAVVATAIPVEGVP